MEWNSLQMGEANTDERAIKEARHKGWLAGVALRLGCGSPGRNPYDRDSNLYLEWNIGFDLGFSDDG